ncbi:MAG: hypothetical protein CL424_03170 [Acidimicrobiaceae bacterium]|nr:hypothetical protein [Acidimicrobiaceae bacterium]
MRTWAQLFPGTGDPISGASSDYRRAANVASGLENSTTVVADEFARVRQSGELGELEGQAARQLVTFVTEVHSRLDDVPPLFRSLHDIVDHHATELAALEKRAADALAVANTRWNAVETAEAEQASAQSAVSQIQGQIRSLDWSTDDPEVVEADREEFQRIESTRLTTLGQRNTALTTARGLLDDSLTERNDIAADERTLVEETASALRSIDIGELDDPNAVLDWISDRVDDVAGFVGGIVDSIVGLVEAIMEGDWGAALWHLSDLLEAALTVLAVVALVAAVVFTGGTALAIIGLALGAAKLAIDAVLAGTQTPHPETGETKSWGDVAIDAAFLVVDVALFGAASRGDAVFRVAGDHKRSVVGNIGQLRNPVSGAGNPLHGAARQSTILRSQRELGASGFDFVEGQLINHTKDQISTAVSNRSNDPGVTTDTGAWTSGDMVDFVESSPLAPSLRRHISQQTATVQTLGSSGPSFGQGSATYCLATP